MGKSGLAQSAKEIFGMARIQSPVMKLMRGIYLVSGYETDERDLSSLRF